jgi:hypothetical protein
MPWCGGYCRGIWPGCQCLLRCGYISSEGWTLLKLGQHAYRGIRLRERPHITDVGHATSTLEQDISKARLPELDLHDLHLAFDSGNRPTHQELDTDSPQKLLAEANVRPYLH